MDDHPPTHPCAPGRCGAQAPDRSPSPRADPSAAFRREGTWSRRGLTFAYCVPNTLRRTLTEGSQPGNLCGPLGFRPTLPSDLRLFEPRDPQLPPRRPRTAPRPRTKLRTPRPQSPPPDPSPLSPAPRPATRTSASRPGPRYPLSVCFVSGCARLWRSCQSEGSQNPATHAPQRFSGTKGLKRRPRNSACTYEGRCRVWNSYWPWTHCVAQAGLELMVIRPPQPPECWDYRCGPPRQLELRFDTS
ncbi:chitin-binding lectin 1-like [Heterocephalus glaber]|uniref:Chitin-binding lectin 1-like n=1 Tax=Heterocephalus glaber TaxID=10181 RepID=A0AAX6RN48_HETGA|nr:chitin-binding lectin 1-like [Heterocephalus glaber]